MIAEEKVSKVDGRTHGLSYKDLLLGTNKHQEDGKESCLRDTHRNGVLKDLQRANDACNVWQRLQKVRGMVFCVDRVTDVQEMRRDVMGSEGRCRELT